MKVNFDRIRQILNLLICIVLVSAISIRKDKRIAGFDLTPEINTDNLDTNVVSVLPNGDITINTSTISRDISGYGGTVPLLLTIRDNKVLKIEALDNEETPSFFKKASALLGKWDGLTVSQARKLKPDAVSGATFSSNAIIQNVQRGLEEISGKETGGSFLSGINLSVKYLIGLIVALLAAILPLFIKNRIYRTVQLILNVTVLGFWCGTFLSYSSIISYMSNGINLVTLGIPVVMLVTAFIYPLFNKPSYYCSNICPFGSLQELSGKCVKYKIKLSPSIIKKLDIFRQILWVTLMFLMLSGIWFDWIDYEPFSAFVFASATWVAIGIAILFTALSTVVHQPYCRFVCPTGSLFKFSQNKKQI